MKNKDTVKLSFLKSNEPLLIIIGPSGSGKSSVVQNLAKRGVVEVTPSWTTRPPRKGEIQCSIEHKFVNDEMFNKRGAEEYFIEIVKLFGLNYRYGLPRITKPENKSVPLIMLRATILTLVPKHYTNYVVYQIEDRPTKVRERLLKRKAEGEQQGTRLRDYKKEIEGGRRVANRVFINKTSVELLADEIEKAIKKDFN